MKDQIIYSSITDFSKAHQPHLFSAVTFSTAYSYTLEMFPIKFNKCIIQTYKGRRLFNAPENFMLYLSNKCACLQALI